MKHFEGYLQSRFGGPNSAEEHRKCIDVLRHKEILSSEQRLVDYQLGPVVAVQRAGEFVITFPKGYHGGFNVGLNVNVAVNYAHRNWIDYGLRATVDNCA